MEVKLRAPRFIDVNRNTTRVCHCRDTCQVGRDAAVRRADEGDEFRIGVLIKGPRNLFGRNPETDVQVRVKHRRNVHGVRASENECYQQGLVEVPRDDDLLPWPQ